MASDSLLSFVLCQPGFKFISFSWFSSDHPKHLCTAKLTEVLNSVGKGFNCKNINNLELNTGRSDSNKLFKQCAPGDFSLATFLCGFQSPTMFLPLDSSGISLLLVFPASFSWSTMSLMFSDRQRLTYPGPHSVVPRKDWQRFWISVFPLSPSLASVSGSEQYRAKFLTRRNHPLRRQKNSQQSVLIYITVLTPGYYLWVIISRRTNNRLYIVNRLIKQEINIYLIWYNAGNIYT